MAEWSIQELIDDLGSHLPVWRIDAQDELVRRGLKTISPADPDPPKSRGYHTWISWTLGRIDPAEKEADEILTTMLNSPTRMADSHQLIRVIAHRVNQRGEKRLPDLLKGFLSGEGCPGTARNRAGDAAGRRNSMERRLVGSD